MSTPPVNERHRRQSSVLRDRATLQLRLDHQKAFGIITTQMPDGSDGFSLIAIISVKIPEPQFEGQTKTKLGNSEVKGLVESMLNEGLATFLEENPNVAKGILSKAIDASRAREAARRARDLARRKKWPVEPERISTSSMSPLMIFNPHPLLLAAFSFSAIMGSSTSSGEKPMPLSVIVICSFSGSESPRTANSI